MNLPKLPALNFYGAIIPTVGIGPRQELTLNLKLWSQKNGQLSVASQVNDGISLSIRLGGIKNFEEIKTFFSTWTENRNAYASLHYLRFDPTKPSKPQNLFVELEFDETEDKILIHCQNLVVLTDVTA